MWEHEEHDHAPRRGTGAPAADQAERHQECHRVGMFDNRSLLFMVLVLRGNGKFMAIDMSREYYMLSWLFFDQVGVMHKVDGAPHRRS